jgi:signal transduction histidine kinase
VTRIQQGALPLHFEQVDLADLADAVIGQIGAGLAPDDTRQIALDAPAPVIGLWDPLRIEQVLWNLISNAVKYSPQGSPVEVKIGREDQQAVITVNDEGAGIDPAVAPQLFEPFARSEGTFSRAGGTGLGLYISKRIVERHGGTLEVTSTPGNGSTFRARIPLRPQREAEPQVQVQAQAEATASE